MSDRLTFRPNRIDEANLAIIATRLQADRRSVFVTRTNTVRAALRIAAEAMTAESTRGPLQGPLSDA